MLRSAIFGVHAMKHILIGTDLSTRSKPALTRAIQLASQHGARLTVIHVVHEDVPAKFVNDILDERRAALDAELASAQFVISFTPKGIDSVGGRPLRNGPIRRKE